MDSLGSLNAFVQTAEARSFTLAGQRLGVSSSAVGKAVSRLEQRLGVRLFHRSTRTVSLTPEGALYLERCRRILGEIEAAEQEMAQTQGAPRGKLRVSMPLASMLMMPTISAFMRAFPQIELDLDFSDRLVNVIEEGFDAVIRAGDTGDSRLMSRKLGGFRFMLVGAKEYFAQHGVPRTPRDLADHACLHHRFATSGKLEPWPLKGGRDIALPAAAIVNTMEPLIYMAEQGHGIACLPDFALRKQMKSGALVSVLDEHMGPGGTFWVLWPSSRYVSPKLRVFVDFLAERLFDAGR